MIRIMITKYLCLISLILFWQYWILSPLICFSGFILFSYYTTFTWVTYKSGSPTSLNWKVNKYLFLHHSFFTSIQKIWWIHTLTVALNLGGGASFVSGFSMLRSIIDRLSSDDAVAIDSLLSCPGGFCLIFSLFTMSSRELKLSDCGTLSIKGFCEERNASQLLHQGCSSSVLTAKAGYLLSRKVCSPLWSWFHSLCTPLL